MHKSILLIILVILPKYILSADEGVYPHSRGTAASDAEVHRKLLELKKEEEHRGTSSDSPGSAETKTPREPTRDSARQVAAAPYVTSPPPSTESPKQTVTGPNPASEMKRDEILLRSSLKKQIRSGDFSAINNLNGTGSLPTLYTMLRLAQLHQFGDANESARTLIIEKITSIPGHGRYLGDKIDKLSNQPFTGGDRAMSFGFLTDVASRESLIELGRFLFDDRNPDQEIAKKHPSDDGSFYLIPNSLAAADGIGSILAAKGVKSPVTRRIPGFYGPAEVRQIQEWWKSQEGVAFRATKS